MMTEEKSIGVAVKKEEDMPEWYEQVCLRAELADFYSPIAGFMVIRPYGYAIWQNIQDYFNKEIIKKYDVRNAYFPLLIPESFFKKEAQHAKGFAPELAWLEKSEENERLAIRPTSETVMYDSYAKWIRSYRDLPLRINQWCNVLRWEVKQTKLFLRTREFLWQEGHCVYATKEEADKETLMILKAYQKLCEELLAIPTIVGKKTEKEKFAGAEYTTTVEAFMPDGKALQMGTSHQLGQGFAKSFGISFLGKDGTKQIPWQTSWGVSTRMIGAVVMIHGDNKGLVLPPRVAPNKIVIVPIIYEKEKSRILKTAKDIASKLKEFEPILDDRDGYTPGWKFNEWEMKGIPIRIEIGPRDIAKKQVVLVRRDTGAKAETKIKELKKSVGKMLADIQANLYKNAKKFLNESIVEAKDWKQFVKAIQEKKLVKCCFCGELGCEERIKEETNATSRCIPFDSKAKGKCIHCNRKAKYEIYFSKSY